MRVLSAKWNGNVHQVHTDEGRMKLSNGETSQMAIIIVEQ